MTCKVDYTDVTQLNCKNKKEGDITLHYFDMILAMYFDEIRKRSARFVLSCIQSKSSFVRSTVRYGMSIVVIFLLVEMS